MHSVHRIAFDFFYLQMNINFFFLFGLLLYAHLITVIPLTATVHVREGGSFFPGVGLQFLGVSDPGGHIFLGRNDWGSFIPRNI